MAHAATLNIRLPEPLKQSGGEVLAKTGISVSEAVRALFEYMAEQQEVPEFLSGDTDNTFAKRRELVRDIAGCIHVPEGFSIKQARQERLDERYAEFL